MPLPRRCWHSQVIEICDGEVTISRSNLHNAVCTMQCAPYNTITLYNPTGQSTQSSPHEATRTMGFDNGSKNLVTKRHNSHDNHDGYDNYDDYKATTAMKNYNCQDHRLKLDEHPKLRQTRICAL